MKRWAVLVVVLYFFILFALTIPLLLVAFYPNASFSGGGPGIEAWFLESYAILLFGMTAAQAVMLLVPVDLAIQRPTSRRSLLWPVLASGLMMGLLGAGLVACIVEFIAKDKALDFMGNGWPLGATFLLVWAAWSIIFYRTGRDAPPADVVTRQCRYLLRGSILELLVAVPTHIVARARDYCCAGFMTFLGLAFGIAVMLFSYGPGVFFLFAQRWKRLHPQPSRPA